MKHNGFSISYIKFLSTKSAEDSGFFAYNEYDVCIKSFDITFKEFYAELKLISTIESEKTEDFLGKKE